MKDRGGQAAPWALPGGFLQASTLNRQGALLPISCPFQEGGLRGNNVLISGFGGGVAQFAFLFAQAAEAMCTSTSGSDEKWRRHWERIQLQEALTLIIDSASGNQPKLLHIKILKPLKIISCSTNGCQCVDLYRMFWEPVIFARHQLPGNDTEFNEMLSFIGQTPDQAGRDSYGFQPK